MRNRTRTLFLQIAVLTLIGLSMLVAGPGLAIGPVTIDEALNDLEIGTYFTVTGEITNQEADRLYVIEDRSGSMVIYVPEYLTRDKGPIQQGERLQIWGKFDQKKLDTSVRGMRVSNFYREGRDLSKSGRNNPGAETGKIVPIESMLDSSPPAAVKGSEPGQINPTVSEELRERYRSKIREYRAAESVAVSAGAAYAHAARSAGPDGQMDPQVLAQLEEAEAKVIEIRNEIPALADEGRKAGVSEDLILMLERTAGLR